MAKSGNTTAKSAKDAKAKGKGEMAKGGDGEDEPQIAQIPVRHPPIALRRTL